MRNRQKQKQAKETNNFIECLIGERIIFHGFPLSYKLSNSSIPTKGDFNKYQNIILGLRVKLVIFLKSPPPGDHV